MKIQTTKDQKILQEDLAADLTALIQELYSQPPIDDITDDDIMEEIKAVR